MPYYLKVREYNDMENRDVWEYELNLSPEEIDRLLMHTGSSGRSISTTTFRRKLLVLSARAS